MKITSFRILPLVVAFGLFVLSTELRAQNPSNPLDVNGNGSISAIDALIVINDLIANGSVLLSRRQRRRVHNAD